MESANFELINTLFSKLANSPEYMLDVDSPNIVTEQKTEFYSIYRDYSSFDNRCIKARISFDQFQFEELNKILNLNLNNSNEVLDVEIDPDFFDKRSYFNPDDEHVTTQDPNLLKVRQFEEIYCKYLIEEFSLTHPKKLADYLSEYNGNFDKPLPNTLIILGRFLLNRADTRIASSLYSLELEQMSILNSEYESENEEVKQLNTVKKILDDILINLPPIFMHDSFTCEVEELEMRFYSTLPYDQFLKVLGEKIKLHPDRTEYYAYKDMLHLESIGFEPYSLLESADGFTLSDQTFVNLNCNTEEEKKELIAKLVLYETSQSSLKILNDIEALSRDNPDFEVSFFTNYQVHMILEKMIADLGFVNFTKANETLAEFIKLNQTPKKNLEFIAKRFEKQIPNIEILIDEMFALDDDDDDDDNSDGGNDDDDDPDFDGGDDNGGNRIHYTYEELQTTYIFGGLLE